MIENLKRKIIVTLMCILSIVFIGIVGSINIVSYHTNQQRVMGFLHVIAQNDGKRPQNSFRLRMNNRPSTPAKSAPNTPPQKNDAIFGLSTFGSVKFDKDGNAIQVFQDKEGFYTKDEIVELAKNALNSGKRSGIADHQMFLVQQRQNSDLVVFADNHFAEDAAAQLFISSCILTLIGLIIMFCISIMISNWLVAPVSKAFELQKQFISDASHELKTPLSVITTNAEVLESEIGENKWLSYIQSEALRMNTLLGELLALARLDSNGVQNVFSEFDLSKAVEGSALPFESTAFESGRTFNSNISEGITFNGNQDKIKQLTAILLDNAFKYSPVNGEISVCLTQISGKNILTVSNTGDPIPEEERKHIFDRFYRTDKARSRANGSYGLGLAIAKSIVTAHGGKIFVDCADGKVIFTVVL